jgi:hypothetical protein
MNTRPCDELGVDLALASLQWACKLNPSVAEPVIEYVCGHYPTDDFEGLLERALDLQLVDDDAERHAYKMAFGHFFYRRAREARQHALARDEIPFAPR